jgi:hypothetical protein
MGKRSERGDRVIGILGLTIFAAILALTLHFAVALP